MSKKCPTCSKTVYFAERITAIGNDYHKLCFKCTQCKKRLEPGKLSEHNAQLYCNSCYSSVIGLKGYGNYASGGFIRTDVSGGAAGTVDSSIQSGNSVLEDGSGGK
eukprot:TRINITY_DN8124_c0_g3_i1.p1 TRINITY_DN8124_c0_g3~~TRINITY_DN8124_c0_g3_i1.p1  ORF type:complete len:106 (-),score=19.06 TRINITY_DN8124_c0_g3_i1:68-385(-)